MMRAGADTGGLLHLLEASQKYTISHFTSVNC